MDEKMEGTLLEVRNKGSYNLLKFRTEQGIITASAFEGLPDLQEGQEYCFSAVRVEKNGKQYWNMRKRGGRVEIAPKLPFMPASELGAPQKAQESPKNGYWPVKDARITRMSCLSSASAIVSRLASEKGLECSEEAKKLTLGLAAAFEGWVLEAV